MFANNSSLVEKAEHKFFAIDYVVLAAFLSISGAVGIFFSIKGHKNTNDYFFGGRQMGPIPVGISNGVSFLSSLALVGYPSEFYIHGSDIFLTSGIGAMAYFLGGVLISLVIYPLKMTSLSEYFKQRYDSKILTYVANIMVLFCIFEYMGSCMLGSVIALNSVTGGQVSVVLGLIIAGSVGIFYTSIGGLKAVVWTDVIQCGFMLAGITTVLIHAVVDTPGGVPTIIELNRKYERIHPLSWSPDMTIRHTFWGLTIGHLIYLMMWPIQPAGVQRICSTTSRNASLLVAAIAGMLFIFMALLPMLAGMNIFGYYASRGCDIHEAGWAKSSEIPLYYVRERLSYPGFQGFFIAALLSGSLSSFSSGLSAATAIMWNDTIVPLLPFEVKEWKATLISKILVVMFGILSLAWCYALYSFGGLILQVTMSIDASMYGAYFGLFLFALLFRWGNAYGALAGIVVSFSIALWLGLGSLLHGKPTVPVLPTTTEYCALNTTDNATIVERGNINPLVRTPLETLYSISYCWLPSICVVVSLLVAIGVTVCTGVRKKRDVNPKHLFPLCRWSSDDTDKSDEKGESEEHEMDALTANCENNKSDYDF